MQGSRDDAVRLLRWISGPDKWVKLSITSIAAQYSSGTKYEVAAVCHYHGEHDIQDLAKLTFRRDLKSISQLQQMIPLHALQRRRQRSTATLRLCIPSSLHKISTKHQMLQQHTTRQSQQPHLVHKLQSIWHMSLMLATILKLNIIVQLTCQPKSRSMVHRQAHHTLPSQLQQCALFARSSRARLALAKIRSTVATAAVASAACMNSADRRALSFGVIK